MAWGLNSAKDIAKNIGGAVYTGFKTGMGEGIGSSLPLHGNSVGGAMSFGGGLVPGAAAGAAYGAIHNDITATEGAAAGAVAGAVALPAVGFAGALGVHAFNNMDKVGSAVFSVGNNLARGSVIAGAGIAKMANSKNLFMNSAYRWGGLASKATGSMVKYEKPKMTWNKSKAMLDETGGGLKLTGIGKTAIGVAGVAGSLHMARETFEQSRMGQMDSYITSATPRIPSYQENAGATGDLVFALNRNRRG